MGLLSIIRKVKKKEKEMRILMVGLDNAGKTTIVMRINGEDTTGISPTLGFNIKTIEYKSYRLNIWDVGGQKTIRSYWRNYFEQTDGMVWVVDSSDLRRLDDCKEELHNLLKEERLSGSSLLILANKQDIQGALRPADIAKPVKGLGVIPGAVGRFDSSTGLRVPHIGWNALQIQKSSAILEGVQGHHVYFVHSYRAMPSNDNNEWVSATCNYGGGFIAAVEKGNVHAVQFHPEKSSNVGLDILKGFLTGNRSDSVKSSDLAENQPLKHASTLAKRVIACLDVRANNKGDLVVTKGDQYDVREHSEEREVRNLGKPVELAGQYYKDGADEVTFLNITGFRDFPLGDLPMLEVLRRTSENVFVPLTIGGGIRDFTDKDGRYYSSLEVASEYFRSGADKISIGSDAVYAAEEYIKTGVKMGTTSLEQISYVYGNQAVVVSIDPRRVYLNSPKDVPFKTVELTHPGPKGEKYAWYQCTVNGGREGRPIGAYELAKAVEDLGAGEILLNCIDCDGQGQGFDIDLVKLISEAVNIPVIASSGAGAVEHFSAVFKQTSTSAALAAGIFHRREVPIMAVKEHLRIQGTEVRI